MAHEQSGTKHDASDAQRSVRPACARCEPASRECPDPPVARSADAETARPSTPGAPGPLSGLAPEQSGRRRKRETPPKKMGAARKALPGLYRERVVRKGVEGRWVFIKTPNAHPHPWSRLLRRSRAGSAYFYFDTVSLSRVCAGFTSSALDEWMQWHFGLTRPRPKNKSACRGPLYCGVQGRRVCDTHTHK
jgi:hypothetical protein